MHEKIHLQISSVESSELFPPQHIMKGTLRSTTARHCTHFFIRLAQSKNNKRTILTKENMNKRVPFSAHSYNLNLSLR